MVAMFVSFLANGLRGSLASQHIAMRYMLMAW